MTAAHHHDHGAGCSHHSAAGLTDTRVALSIGLTLAFVAVEWVAAWFAHSLALASDAGHNLLDALALGVSAYAIRMARRPPTPERTFGYHRAGILAALFNGVLLMLVAVMILREAVIEFLHPHEVHGGLVMAAAAVALAVNAVVALWLRDEARHSLNVRSAFIHMVGDALSAAAVVAGGLLIMVTAQMRIDPVVSALIGIFIAVSAYGVVSETVNVLLEGAPASLDVREIAAAAEAVDGVEAVHDLHVWTIADGIVALSCHLHVAPAAAQRSGRVVGDVKRLIASRFGITHTTIESECEGCAPEDATCGMPRKAG